MSDLAPFHPDWLISFWLGTPILNKLNPHIILLVLLVVAVVIFMRKRKKIRQQEPDNDEKQFQILLRKKSVIEDQMTRLETLKSQGKIQDEQYSKNMDEYKQHLDSVKKELLRFT